MSPTYDKTLQIDRKDNNANYSPENCRWATNKENSRNKRTNRLLSFNGVTQPVSAWAESMGLSKQAIRHRLEAGMSIKDTLTLPIHKKTDKKMKYDIA